MSDVRIESRNDADKPAIRVEGIWLSESEVAEFARADGFSWPVALRRWFADQYGLPFDGIMIEWEHLQPDWRGKGGRD